jgi:tetratricopeptide (TPR) repeat protein
MRTLIALSFGLALAPAAANADPMQDCFNDLNANAYARAVASCTQAIKAQPKNPFWYNNRCKAYRYTGDYERALADCTTSIELNNPALNVPLTNRGDVYLAKGDFDRAAADYRRALEINPNHDLAHKGLAELAARKGESSSKISIVPLVAHSDWVNAVALSRATDSVTGQASLSD